MAITPKSARIAPRLDTAANYTSNNPTLSANELAIESDTGRKKLGDGTTAWTSLDYLGEPDVPSLVDYNDDGNMLKVVPQDGYLLDEGFAIAGAIKLVVPNGWSDTFITLRLVGKSFDHVDDGGQSWSLDVGGYPQSSGSAWIRCGAYLHGKLEVSSSPRVRFGHDGADPFILIGEVTDVSISRIYMYIDSVLLGWTGAPLNEWKSGWSASMVTTETGMTFTGPDLTNLGYAKYSDIAEGEGIVRKTGDQTFEAIKTNLAATTAPTVNEDTGDGYAVGSLWIDVTNDKAYYCVDATAAAAVWVQLGGGGVTVNVQKFTGSGTWDHSAAGSPSVVDLIIVSGGGGGGGGANHTTAGNWKGGGGGGGASQVVFLKDIEVSADVTVTIGSGGTSGAALGEGGTGGVSSFGSLEATPGLGGRGAQAGPSTNFPSINYDGLGGPGGGSIALRPLPTTAWSGVANPDSTQSPENQGSSPIPKHSGGAFSEPGSHGGSGGGADGIATTAEHGQPSPWGTGGANGVTSGNNAMGGGGGGAGYDPIARANGGAGGAGGNSVAGGAGSNGGTYGAGAGGGGGTHSSTPGVGGVGGAGYIYVIART